MSREEAWADRVAGTARDERVQVTGYSAITQRALLDVGHERVTMAQLRAWQEARLREGLTVDVEAIRRERDR